MTVREMFDAYLARIRVTGKRQSYATAKCHAKRWIRVLGAKTDVVEALRGGRVEDAMFTRVERGLSRSGVNQSLTYWRAAWSLAADRGLLPPIREVARVKKLTVNRKAPTALDDTELEMLLTSATDALTRCIMLLAAYAGLRHQEILHLAVDDVDCSARLIRVRGKAWPGGEWTPKSRADRTVPMSGRLVEPLERLVADWANVVLEGQPFWVFQRGDGRRILDRSDEVRDAFRTADLYDPDRRPGLHMLRRTFATNLARKGVPIVAIRDLMGHSDVLVTEGYIAVPPDVLVRAVELL